MSLSWLCFIHLKCVKIIKYTTKINQGEREFARKMIKHTTSSFPKHSTAKANTMKKLLLQNVGLQRMKI